MNKFNVGDWVECVDNIGVTGITKGSFYQVVKVNSIYTGVICDTGAELDYFHNRFKLYQPSLQPDTVLEEKYIKEFLKKLEYVLWNDTTVFNCIENRNDELKLEADVATIYGVDDIYIYISTSYDQLTSQAVQKRKQELLDKKAKLDLELAQINGELEGL